MSASPPLETLPDALLDTLVSHIIQTCPTLAVALLSAFGTRIHTSAVRVLFTSITLPDDARYFAAPNVSELGFRHPISAILLNAERYARVVKRIYITDVGLSRGPADLDAVGSLGLMTIKEDDSDGQEVEKRTRDTFEPVTAESVIELLMVCTNLEEFVWSSPSPPPDGVCETLSEQNLRLINFTFKPEAPLRTPTGAPSGGVQPPASRPAVPKWDAPSLPLLATLPLTKLHVTRLSQQGSRALAVLFAQFGEYSLLEDVSLDFVWLDDPLCEKLVEAGRRIRRLKIGTSGTKLTDKGIVSLFEGCDSLEDFELIEAQGRLSRNLWSKLPACPDHLRKFKVAISESGPHHSWTADHLLSFSKLQVDVLSHLSVVRIIQSPYFSTSGDTLEYDAQIDDVAALKGIPREVVASIRGATTLTVLECDWWAWKPDDVKALLERCTQLEYLKLAFDAPFAKLLTLTSAFSPLTRLLKLSVSIPAEHAPGPIPVPTSPTLKMSPTHPLTPAASPVRRRTSLPSPDPEVVPQIPGSDELKFSGSVDPSLPHTRDVKRFVKKCPRLIDLEWYGRNARGKWLVSRSVTTSKINTNVTVEYCAPVVPPSVWNRATRERAIAEVMQSGGYIYQNKERQGQVWTGFKAEQFFAERVAEKEKEEIASPEKPARTNGSNKRFSNSLATISANVPTLIEERLNGSSHSPVQPFTPLSPPTSTKSFATAQDNVPAAPAETTRAAGQSTNRPRRTPSEPSLRANGGNNGNNRARSATASTGSAQGGSGSSSGRGRNGNSGGGSGSHRDGRGRGANSGKSGGGQRRNTAANGSSGSGRGGGGGGRGRGGGKRKVPTSTN